MEPSYQTVRDDIKNKGMLSDASAAFLLKKGLMKAQEYRAISHEDREDAVQNALLALLTKIANGEYDDTYSPATYFFQAVIGYCLTVYRKNKIRKQGNVLESLIEGKQIESPSQSLEEEEELRQIKEILSIKQQEVLTLKMLGLKGHEIAGVMDVTPQMISLHWIAIQAAIKKVSKRK